MSTSILGTGLAFPVLPVDSKLPVASGEDKIRQSIWLILATAPGERVMLPAFGCGVYDLVFAPNTAAFRGSVAAVLGASTSSASRSPRRTVSRRSC
jgi:phage baseplate assembly protein W